MSAPTPKSSNSDQPASGGPGSELLTLEQAAEILGVHYMTAYRYVRSGRLAAVQESGRWQVTSEELDRFSSGAKANRRKSERRNGGGAAEVASSDLLQPQLLADMLEHGDENAAWSAVEPFAVSSENSRENWVDLLSASLKIIGDRWQTGDTSVAEEHRASVVALRLIGRLGARSARPGRKKGTVVLAAAPGDLHGLPTALAAEALRGAHYNLVDLGADVPVDETWKLARTTDRLLAVGFCATTEMTEESTTQLAEAVGLVHSKIRVPVIVGGAGVKDQKHFETLGADVWTRSLPELLSQMELIRASHKWG